MNYKTASTIFYHYENKSGDRIRFPRLFILFWASEWFREWIKLYLL